MLGDLGVQIDDWVEEDQDSDPSLIDPEEEQPEEQVADEALRLLRTCWNSGRSGQLLPARSGCLRLLTKEEEIRLAQGMEAGMDRVLSALAGYPPAVVSCCGTTMASVTMERA